MPAAPPLPPDRIARAHHAMTQRQRLTRTKHVELSPIRTTAGAGYRLHVCEIELEVLDKALAEAAVAGITAAVEAALAPIRARLESLVADALAEPAPAAVPTPATPPAEAPVADAHPAPSPAAAGAGAASDTPPRA